MNNLTPSPYVPPEGDIRLISREVFEKIRGLLGGVEALCIIADRSVHSCTHESDCLGHWTSIRSDGFNGNALAGIGDLLMNEADDIAKSHENLDY